MRCDYVTRVEWEKQLPIIISHQLLSGTLQSDWTALPVAADTRLNAVVGPRPTTPKAPLRLSFSDKKVKSKPIEVALLGP